MTILWFNLIFQMFFISFKPKSRTIFYLFIFNHKAVPSTCSSVKLKGLLEKKFVGIIKDTIKRLELIELFKK